jgi:hypothetical protein
MNSIQEQITYNKKTMRLFKLVSEKNDLNSKRRRLLAKSSKLFWTYSGPYQGWSDPSKLKEYNSIRKEIETLRVKRRTYTPKIRRLINSTNFRLAWDVSGFCSVIYMPHKSAIYELRAICRIVKNHPLAFDYVKGAIRLLEIHNTFISRHDVKIKSEEYEINKILLGT